ncbi:MAG TPA: NUDIX hydrolase [Bacillota bacterium]|nr:NUDIX hydrolase [Bacillota bacterium]
MEKSHQSLIEIPQKKELIYQGKYLAYHLDHVLLPNGHTATREYLHHPGAIAAVPLLEDGSVILVEQFRYPIESVLLEIPAGKLEQNEAPEECVKRELREEIGYEPGRLTHLLSVWTTPGFTDEIIHLYLATDLKPAADEADPDEFLNIVRLTKPELLAHLNSGNVIDGKTSLALSMMSLRGLW